MSESLELSTTELKTFLTHIVKTNKTLKENGKHPVTVNVVGPAGIGKTTTIGDLAKELGYSFTKVNLAQFDELGDLLGFPVKEFQMKRNIGTKESPKWTAKWVDEDIVEDYKNLKYQVTGNHRMGYSIPEWVPTKPKSIILLDDFSRAQSRFIQATMELIATQEYTSWKLPEDCTVILSSNPDDGKYFVSAEDVAQKSRYITVDMKFDVASWSKWAESAEIDGRGINFINMHPEVVTEEINARAITNFFNAISGFSSLKDNLGMVQMIGEGAVGLAFSALFTTFINNKLDKLVSPKEILTGGTDESILAKLKDAIGVNEHYRADIASVLCTRFANYAVMHANKSKVDDAIISRITTLVTENVFGDDLQYFAIREILNGNKQKYSKLMLNSDIVKMATR